MAAKTIRLHEFERLVRQHNCTIRKTTKEWEIVDNVDGRWLCGFATVSGREVKVTYVKNFRRQVAVQSGTGAGARAGKRTRAGARTMNKHAIQKTAVGFWCDDDECFVVQSPLMDSIMGAGDTISEALREFTDILSDAYEAYLEGRMGNEKPGRPQKNRIAMNTDVKLSTRESVKEMAKDFECSQGEVIDFLLCFYEHNANSNQRIYSEGHSKNPIVAESASKYSCSGTAANKSLEEKVADLSHRLSAIESQLGSTDSTKSVQKSKRVRK